MAPDSPPASPQTSMAPFTATVCYSAFVQFLPVSTNAVCNVSSHSSFTLPQQPRTPQRQRHVRHGLHRPQPRICASSAQKLPPSTISVRDTATRARILLVGCVHGSRVSADDVRKVLDRTTPDAVVLELCDSRLQTLRMVVSHTSARNQRLSQGFDSRKRQSFAQLSSTFGGAGPALIAFFLDTVYRLQILAGVDPGIEFVEPIRRYDRSRIVCGDAPARDTVKKLFNVFISPVDSVTGSLPSIKDLVGRIFLPPSGGINMAALFVTDISRLAELARLLLPVTVVSTMISLVGNAGAAALDSAPSISGLSVLKDGASGIFLPGVWAVLQMFAVAYIIVSTLRFMKVLISDRDKVLTRSILDTAARLRSESDGELTLCVVVGLLHANGILRLLEHHNGKM